MTNEKLIEVDGLWKKYARNSGDAMRYGVSDAIAAALGRDGSKDLRKGEFWSLSDVSLTVARGEALGVCGHNGAGKTTLLKTLGGLLRPDRGTVRVSGRIAWLVDIGAGLNPKLSGWENARLRSDMAGVGPGLEAMRRDLDEFTEMGEFLDTPVGYYSSGMKAKLGFAIATMTRPDVLIVDETLAVGDLSFRMKCYDRISDICEDAAVLFVSHGMPHVARICTKGCFLEGGKVLQFGNVDETIRLYNSTMSKGAKRSSGFNAESLRISSVNSEPEATPVISEGEGVSIRFQNALNSDDSIIQTVIRDVSGSAVALSKGLQCGRSGEFEMTTPELHLRPGTYETSLIAKSSNGRHLAVSAGREIIIEGTQGANISYAPHAELKPVNRKQPTS